MLTATLGTPQPPKSVHRPWENYAELCELKWRSKNWNRTSGEAPRGGGEWGGGGPRLQAPPCWGVSRTHRRPVLQENPGLGLEAPDSEQVLTVGTGRPLVVAWRFAAALRAPRVKGRANSPGIQIAPDAEYLMWGWLPISPPTGHCWSRNRHTKWLGGRTSLDNEG